MTVKSYSVLVTETPTLIAENVGTRQGVMEVWINNTDITHDVHIGGPGVTIANGYVLTKFTTTGVANKATVKLFATDALYAVCGAGKTATVGIFITGRIGEN